MASHLAIKIGQVEEQLVAQESDTKVAETVKAFAYATGAAPDATNEQMARHVLRELGQHMVRIARRYKQAEAARIAETEAGGTIGF